MPGAKFVPGVRFSKIGPTAAKAKMPKPTTLAELRASLNPLTRFDFGILAALTHAKQWQAKERKSDETV